MAVKIAKRSRLQFAELLETDGVEFWDLLDYPSLPEQPDDIRYQVRSVDRIDTLAAKYYGDAALWWVIAVANNLDILPTELRPGEYIRIPSSRYILQDLFKRVK